MLNNIKNQLKNVGECRPRCLLYHSTGELVWWLSTQITAEEKLFFRRNVKKKKLNNTFLVFKGLVQLITILLSCYRFDNVVVNGAAVWLLVHSDHLIRLKVNAAFSKGQSAYLHLSSNKRMKCRSEWLTLAGV